MTIKKKVVQAGISKLKYNPVVISKDYKQWKATENRDLQWDVSDNTCQMFLMVKI